MPISPNKSDIVEIQHPQYLSQFVTKKVMLRFKTMDELWQQFIEEHNEMAVGMQNSNLSNTAPMILSI